MRTEHDQRTLEGRVIEGQPQPSGPAPGRPGHGGHGWMMIICCIPMLVIAVILVATGRPARRRGLHADDGHDDARQAMAAAITGPEIDHRS